MSTPVDAQATSWVSVCTLAVAAFIFITTEFVPVGLLSVIGNSFDMTTAQVGPMLTVYAWTVSIMSLPMMLLTRNIERRLLLKITIGLLIASHIVLSLAPNFTMVVLSRIGIALAHAIFWSITAALVVRLAPGGNRARALSLLAMGASLAMVLGIPIGRVLGEGLGWRTTFAVIAVVASLIWILLAKTLPLLPSQNSGNLRSLPILFKRPALVALYCTTALAITANFTAYTYIESFVQSVAGFDPSVTTWLLLLFGMAGLIGSVLFSTLHTRLGNALLPVATASLSACLILMLWASWNLYTLVALVIVWGMTMICLGIQMQSLVFQLAPDATDVANALHSGIYNIGIGAGALVGSLVVRHLGTSWVGFTGAILALAALALCWTTTALFSKAAHPAGNASPDTQSHTGHLP
jgi:DHA1 family purine ribonucleoside efflux pump-like MFS transporter/DHA1 family L-arabinose/isopropyl-beta-D-thiogalactopyranoside export protein-like MFS transporter